MVGKVEWRNSDPNHKGRGAGWYWHRGKGVYSLYKGTVDGKVKAKYKHIKNIKDRVKAQMEYPHTGDYRQTPAVRTLKKSWHGHPVKRTKKGYY